ncbi:MAG: CoA-binding protein [Gammaproteobacteria bacterium]|nr:CoA-binding protein [Gammaproteobacteria bacterium]
MTRKAHHQTVVVLGASAKPQRFSYQAVKLLKQYGHTVIPVHPKITMLNNIAVVANLSDIRVKVDTLTLYIGPERSQLLVDEIIALQPRRVIFNPGTESVLLEEALSHAGIAFCFDCTLVMLQTNQFGF